MPTPVPAPGASVWIRQRRWIVDRARVDRSVLRLDVSSGPRRLTFLSPFDRPLLPARRLLANVRRAQALARFARAAAETHAFDLPRAALHAPLAILPYQLEPTLALLSGVRRVLVADEVGLGKTMAAGLALAELQERQAAFRALVLVPAPLIDQWVSELRDRLGLTASAAHPDVLERQALDLGGGASPWDRGGIRVASPDYLKQRHVLDALPLQPWDVLVIDEAHVISGDSARHDACDELARRARHVLLLTATPHGGDDGRFRRLLAIGALPHTGDDLVVFRRTRGEVTDRPAPAMRWIRAPISAPARQVLDALSSFERAVTRAASPAQKGSAHLLLSVFRKRSSSTLVALDQSLERRLEWLQAPDRGYRLDWLQPPLPFVEEEAHDAEERLALIGDTGLAALHERTWIRRLRVLCAAALATDPKPRHLAALLARGDEPAVVFTEYRASLDSIQRRLSAMRPVAVLHGGLTARERRAALGRFLDEKAAVLLATDVGGQGLNLQSRGRWVINLDVPWNPVRLQQRTGRVDRIGQRRRVHVSTLLLDHAVDARVVDAMTRRAARAAHAIAPAAAIGQSPRLASPSGAPPPGIEPCTAFARRARAIAHVLIARRALAARWRGPFSFQDRPWRTAASAPGRAAAPGDLVLLVTFTLVDAQGATIERHLRAVRVIVAAGDAATPAACLRRAQDALAPVIRARVARVTRVLSARSLRQAAHEADVSRLLHARAAPEDTQLAFFSQREHTAFDRARQLTRLVDARASARIEAAQSGARASAGEFVLVGVFAGTS